MLGDCTPLGYILRSFPCLSRGTHGVLHRTLLYSFSTHVYSAFGCKSPLTWRAHPPDPSAGIRTQASSKQGRALHPSTLQLQFVSLTNTAGGIHSQGLTTRPDITSILQKDPKLVWKQTRYPLHTHLLFFCFLPWAPVLLITQLYEPSNCFFPIEIVTKSFWFFFLIP